MKYQVLFSLKINEKVFINVVCYSRGKASKKKKKKKKKKERKEKKRNTKNDTVNNLAYLSLCLFIAASLSFGFHTSRKIHE